MKKQWGHTIQLKKALLLMGFFCLVTLFSSFAVINDETRFQIELIIQHQFNQVLAVSEYNVQIEEDLEGNKVVTVSPENATDVFGICYLDYTSNVYGLNKIYLHAYPLYRVFEEKGYEVSFPSLKLCTDNGAMVAGLGYRYIADGVRSGMDLSASARVSAFKKN